jgi:hypothetical protein
LPLHVYGNATGNQNRISASSTDWNIIRQFFARYKGEIQHSVHINKNNPAVLDRVNCVNPDSLMPMATSAFSSTRAVRN